MATKQHSHVFVVVTVCNFLSQVIFVFLLLLGMVMHVNEVETKEKYNLREIKNYLQYLHDINRIFALKLIK